MMLYLINKNIFLFVSGKKIKIFMLQSIQFSSKCMYYIYLYFICYNIKMKLLLYLISYSTILLTCISVYHLLMTSSFFFI